MLRTRWFLSSLVLSISFALLTSASTNQLKLRHKLTPGLKADTMTEVQMQGDSFLTGAKAATQLRMQMQKIMQVNKVDSFGNATMDVNVQRIRTQGKMENSDFNKDLTGDELKSVMFGADHIGVEVSPMGQVSGTDGNAAMQKLGITLPASVGDSGGFEFPTFPVEPILVGDKWTENGVLLRGVQAQRSNLSGDSVYQLNRIYNSPNGRMAVIRYQKVSDLSGLGLGGGSSLSGQTDITGSASANVGGLVIQLSGEIEFNIDRGVVVKSTQQGFWNLNMDIGLGGVSNLMNPSLQSQNRKQNAKLDQKMKIKILSKFQWSGFQEPKTTQKAQTRQRLFIPPKIEPLPPTVEILPKAKTDELP